MPETCSPSLAETAFFSIQTFGAVLCCIRYVRGVDDVLAPSWLPLRRAARDFSVPLLSFFLRWRRAAWRLCGVRQVRRTLTIRTFIATRFKLMFW